MADAWRDLAYLESADLAQSLYRETHGGCLSAQRSHAIVASITQGRRYFEAAAASDLLVRPVLLFYGAIALARGLITFIDRTRGEEALSPSHGVQAEGWLETLGGGAVPGHRLKRIPDLRATFSEGTFTELLSVTGNVESARVSLQPPVEPLEARTTGTRDLDGVSLTFRDVLARVPDLAMSYARTFEARSECYPADVTYYKNKGETVVDVLKTTFVGLPTPEEVREVFALPATTEVSIEPHRFLMTVLGDAVRFVLLDSGDAGIENDLAVVQSGDGGTFVMPPREPRLSLLLTLYLVAFFTGTLARYHPSLWMALQAAGPGDRVGPIIREAIGVVQTRFPSLVVREIHRSHPGTLLA